MASSIKNTQRRLEEQGYTQPKGKKAEGGKGSAKPAQKMVAKKKKQVSYGK